MPVIYDLITADNGKLRYSELKFCHNCGSSAIYYDPKGFEIENRETKGLWSCTECNASVTAHKDGRPQGYLASRYIRTLRFNFHQLMRSLYYKGYTYEEITHYLQARLNIPAEYMHAGWFTQGELVYAMAILNDKIKRPARNTPFHVKHVKERKMRRKQAQSYIDRKKRQEFYGR